MYFSVPKRGARMRDGNYVLQVATYTTKEAEEEEEEPEDLEVSIVIE